MRKVLSRLGMTVGVIAVLMGLLVVGVSAAECSVCGKDAGTAVTGATTQLGTGHYYLSEDVEINTQIKVTGDATLCLHDKTLSLKEWTNTQQNFILVNAGASLSICGGAEGTGTISGNGAVNTRAILAQGSVTLNSGTITDFAAMSGQSGGAFVVTGSLTIKGGTISNNTAGNWGGAIYSAGTVTIEGGTISGNTSSADAAYAGVLHHHASAAVTITGGTFEDPFYCNNAGNIVISGGTFKGALVDNAGAAGTFVLTGGTYGEDYSANTGWYDSAALEFAAKGAMYELKTIA